MKKTNGSARRLQVLSAQISQPRSRRGRQDSATMVTMDRVSKVVSAIGAVIGVMSAAIAHAGMPFPDESTPKAVDLGPLAAEASYREMSVTVALGLRDLAAAESLLKSLHTPGDPQFHRFLTPEQLNGVTALLGQYLNGARLGLLNYPLYLLAALEPGHSPLKPIAYGDNWFYHGTNGYNPAAGLGTLDVAGFAKALK